MLTSTPLYRAALPFPHRRVTEVRVLHDGVDITPAGGVPVTVGDVQANLSDRVTRTAVLEIPGPEFFPSAPDDLLSPYVAVIKIRAGIGYPDGSSELFDIFTGRVITASLSPDGVVRIECEDLAQDVVAFRFETPENSEVGASTIDQIQHLILQAVPSATFGTNDVTDQGMPPLTWDEDRGQALDDLAAAMSGRWYALGNGDFVVRLFPYFPSTPVLFIADGRPDATVPGSGLISTATRTVSRVGSANSIVVVSERMEADQPPIRVIARNGDPSSSTFFGPTFGFVTQILKPQTPVDFASAQELAQDQLDASTALTEQWTVNMVPDYALEPGDTVELEYRGQRAVQVIDRVSYPLTAGNLMTLSTRATANLGAIGG